MGIRIPEIDARMTNRLTLRRTDAASNLQNRALRARSKQLFAKRSALLIERALFIRSVTVAWFPYPWSPPSHRRRTPIATLCRASLSRRMPPSCCLRQTPVFHAEGWPFGGSSGHPRGYFPGCLHLLSDLALFGTISGDCVSMVGRRRTRQKRP